MVYIAVGTIFYTQPLVKTEAIRFSFGNIHTTYNIHLQHTSKLVKREFYDEWIISHFGKSIEKDEEEQQQQTFTQMVSRGNFWMCAFEMGFGFGVPTSNRI